MSREGGGYLCEMEKTGTRCDDEKGYEDEVRREEEYSIEILKTRKKKDHLQPCRVAFLMPASELVTC